MPVPVLVGAVVVVVAVPVAVLVAVAPDFGRYLTPEVGQLDESDPTMVAGTKLASVRGPIT